MKLSRWFRVLIPIVLVLGVALASTLRPAYTDDLIAYNFGPFTNPSASGETDSLSGNAGFTTPVISCNGARAVHFFVRDSLPINAGSCSGTCLSDSLAQAVVEVSHDSTNWMVITVPAPNTVTQHDTSGCQLYGDVAQVRLRPSDNGGWRRTTLISGYGDAVLQSSPTPVGIPVRFCRMRVANQNRAATPNTTEDADMYNLRIRVVVIAPRNSGAFRIRTP